MACAQVLMPASTEPTLVPSDTAATLAVDLQHRPYAIVADALAAELKVASLDAAAHALLLPAERPRLLAFTRLHNAAASDAAAVTSNQRFVVMPLEPLAILDLPQRAAADPMQVLLSSSVCATHPHSVPPALLPATLGHLAEAATPAVPTMHTAAAAALLASMLHGPEVARWRPHLPPLHALLDRVFATYMATHRVMAGRERHTHTGSSNTTTGADTSADGSGSRSQGAHRRRTSGHAIAPGAWARHLPQGESAMLLLPQLRRTYRPVAPAGANVQSPILLAQTYSPVAQPAANADASPATAAAHVATSDLANTIEALDALVAACAGLDFSTFLHGFNSRIAVNAAADSNVPAHTAALRAVTALLRTHAGCATVLRHVVLLAEAVLRLLDPACSRRRAACFPVRVCLLDFAACCWAPRARQRQCHDLWLAALATCSAVRTQSGLCKSLASMSSAS